jgi:hypothetical protein
MTTTDTTTEGAVPDASATDADETPAAGTGTPGEAENGAEAENDSADSDSDEPRGRAGQYRKRAQDAETARDAAEARATDLAANVERLQRLHVEQAVAQTGIKPAAVFAVAELADLLGDDGLPDADKVTAAVATARDQLGINLIAAPQRQIGMRSGAGTPPPKKDSWASAFAPRDE